MRVCTEEGAEMDGARVRELDVWYDRHEQYDADDDDDVGLAIFRGRQGATSRKVKPTMHARSRRPFRSGMSCKFYSLTFLTLTRAIRLDAWMFLSLCKTSLAGVALGLAAS
ncbi:hypothetical protein PHSY_000059 [Pseudozyma hubeiensis SY62]|uniref:Uncharacterized protein n=1 Tax=Pseudozyma hubeiensis (strain SY62) TaxID=1305764 RepID=R9P325_PSEHS|nr:hypothetical protein PHSY_000059 [Pseudozyma hubeiensis SY62]GAC92505.1 hypothetical protein PHSY_000059 [Pseudozyma hubeiensis SY62]